MSQAAPAHEALGEIVIYRSVNGDGETYALESGSREQLQRLFGDRAHFRSRIFLAHETKADHHAIAGSVAPHVVMLLTGLPEDQITAEGGVVIFQDPVTEQALPRQAQ